MKSLNIKPAIAFIFVSLFALSALTVNAQSTKEHAKEISQLETYSLPKIQEQPELKYPFGERRRLQEGWVEVNFMVDASGETFEPTIIDTSHGGEAFIDPVLEHIKESKYKPATYNGKPVEAGTQKRYRFEMRDNYQGTTTRAFYRRYNSFNDALEKDDQVTAKKYLNELLDGRAKNLYDDTYLNLAQYFYEEKYGSKDKSMYYLDRALTDRRQSEYLPKELYKQALGLLFQTQTTQNYFREALNTYSLLTKSEDNFELLTKLEPYIGKIEALRSNDSVYAIPTELDEDGDWYIRLFKSGFSFADVIGTINEIQLRCSRKYIFFEYLADKEYHIPKSYGNCSVRVIGDPETSFKFVQFLGITNTQ